MKRTYEVTFRLEVEAKTEKGCDRFARAMLRELGHESGGYEMAVEGYSSGGEGHYHVQLLSKSKKLKRLRR